MTAEPRRTRYAVEPIWSTPYGLRPGYLVEAVNYASALAQAAHVAKRSAGARALAFRADLEDFAEPRVLAEFGRVPPMSTTGEQGQ